MNHIPPNGSPGPKSVTKGPVNVGATGARATGTWLKHSQGGQSTGPNTIPYLNMTRHQSLLSEKMQLNPGDFSPRTRQFPGSQI